MVTDDSTIFSDFLTALGVKHTVSYSDKQFRSMPFHTVFGLSKLLQSYGVPTAGLQLGDKSDALKIRRPFIAETPRGFIIVTSINEDKATYLSQGVSETISSENLLTAITGRVLVAFPNAKSIEPDYDSHRFTEIANRYKKWVLAACCVALFAYMFISNRIYAHASTILVSIIDLAGIYITYLLVQKSAHIKNKHADAVCSVVEAGGCDDVLNMSASKFFGIFGWSEVGFAYFSVSLLCLLVFPQYTPYLAACNLLCLPFSFWSVWYQKFRAKTWCTLCLCVQTMLWLLFFCYLGGGWLKDVFPIRIEFFVLGISYVAVMLGLNAVMPLIDRNNNQ